MSQPTVSQQVHALERQLGDQLIEPFGRGSRLTETGKLLVELISPAVLSISSLKQAYQQAVGELRPRLVVAASPRALVEDLPECVRAFVRRYPRVRLILREYRREQIPASVEAGEVDFGLTGTHSTHDEDPWSYSPWLECEPWYELDTILVTPKDHPLARKRTVRPRDLVGYPLVNSPEGIPDQITRATLDKLGVFREQTSCIQATLAAAIYRFVELGFGIGLTGRRPGGPSAGERPRTGHEPALRPAGRLSDPAEARPLVRIRPGICRDHQIAKSVRFPCDSLSTMPACWPSSPIRTMSSCSARARSRGPSRMEQTSPSA